MDDDKNTDRDEEKNRPTREVDPLDMREQLKKREQERQTDQDALVVDPGDAKPEATAHMKLDPSMLIPGIRRNYGTRVGPDLEFVPVPIGVEPPEGGAAWRILMVPEDSSLKTLALEIWTDAVVGRGEEADVNLADHMGNVKGVSRRHALFRPSPSALFLLDLGSSNGTQVNAVPLNQGMAHKVAHDDLVVFGRLQFTIFIEQSLEVED